MLEPDEALSRAHELLNSVFWLPTLSSAEGYARTHDDCDGDRTQKLQVVFSEDGDAWVAVHGEPFGSLRFREPFIGGGASPRVRVAFLSRLLSCNSLFHTSQCTSANRRFIYEHHRKRDTPVATSRILPSVTQALTSRGL